MKVKVNNSCSEWFETKTGVRQGDPLSALLLSAVLDSVITNLEVRGNITTRLKQICAYAGDIVIIGRTKQILIETFCKLKHEALNAGLTVNNNKTKYLYYTRKIFQLTYLNTGEEQFGEVNSFKYLGSMVNTDNSIEEEIKERIAAGNRAYRVHKNREYHVHKNRAHRVNKNGAYRVHTNREYRVHKNRAYHVHKKYSHPN